MVIGSMLIALDIIFTRFFSLMLFGVDRISLQFVPNALAGYFLGPWWGAFTLITGDILGMVMNPAGFSINPGFTLSAAMRGVLYGLILYNKPVTFKRTAIAISTVTIIVDLGLNPIWLALMSTTSGSFLSIYSGILLQKIPTRMIFIVAATTIFYLILKPLSRIPDLKIERK